MATHSSVLAWRIPGTGEPGGLPSMVKSQNVGSHSPFNSVQCSQDFSFDFLFPLQVLWALPCGLTEELAELPSLGSHRIGHVKRLSSSSREYIEKQRYYFANKGPSSQGYGFSSGHVWM